MTQTTQIRDKFFDYLFEGQEGFVCIAVAEAKRARTTFKQNFFRWPNQKDDLSSFIEKIGQKKNVWYSPSLLDKSERKKENALPGNIVWADLDTADPKDITPAPNVVVESSPGRYQALWRLSEKVPPEQAEEYSRRIAYEYKQDGADPSGWDIGQLLRVPLTKNFKYESQPQVRIIQAVDDPHELEEFEKLTAISTDAGPIEIGDIPDLSELPEPETVIYKYHIALRSTAFNGLYSVEPNRQDDWSKMLWRLINICIEAGMTQEETFLIANNSACNKYRRDDRPASYLWRDVSKAFAEQAKLTLITATYVPLQMPQLATFEDVTHTFIDDYREWATEATDALPAYHDLCAFTLLSTFTAGGLFLQTQYGKSIPNIWGLLLGDSTLTRKTTAMRLAIDFINEIDSELILATDGSVEGLLTGLSLRPNRVSMFWKDEVSGFFDSINRKDYLAGMPETLTQLYDVPPFFSRRLRKETITLSSPIFIFFGGGIRDKVYSLTSEEYVLSGFLPRFLVVSGDTDITRIRRTGPPKEHETIRRNALKSKLTDMYENYNRTAMATIGGQQVELEAGIEAILTPEAWKRYGDIEMEMVSKASESAISMIALPTFERLSRSCLKMSCLLAASQQEPDENHKIEVTEQDVTNASAYISLWGGYSADLISNAGKGTTQRTLEKILTSIKDNPGVTRSWIMQRYHLNSREANEVFNTLQDRGEIRTKKEGRGYTVWAI